MDLGTARPCGLRLRAGAECSEELEAKRGTLGRSQNMLCAPWVTGSNSGFEARQEESLGCIHLLACLGILEITTVLIQVEHDEVNGVKSDELPSSLDPRRQASEGVSVTV